MTRAVRAWNRGERPDAANEIEGEESVTKSQLIEAVAERGGLTRKKAELVVNTIFSSMENALIRGDRIEIRGFGSFKTKHYPPYIGRNPKTGEPIPVAAKVLPVFKVGRELRERVHGDDGSA